MESCLSNMDNLRESPSSRLKSEIAAIRNDLPKDIRERIFKRFPEYNTYKNGTLINNVLAGTSSDARLTEIIKALYFEYKITQP